MLAESISGCLSYVGWVDPACRGLPLIVSVRLWTAEARLDRDASILPSRASIEGEDADMEFGEWVLKASTFL